MALDMYAHIIYALCPDMILYTDAWCYTSIIRGIYDLYYRGIVTFVSGAVEAFVACNLWWVMKQALHGAMWGAPCCLGVPAGTSPEGVKHAVLGKGLRRGVWCSRPLHL